MRRTFAQADLDVQAAELAVAQDAAPAADVVFTADHALEKPEATGAALAAFLREKRFTSSRAVAGVPARVMHIAASDEPSRAMDEVLSDLAYESFNYTI